MRFDRQAGVEVRTGFGRGRTVRRRAGIALTAAVVLGTTACAGAVQEAQSGGQAGDTLTVVTIAPPQSLDPAKAQQNDAWFEQLAYEPLVVRHSDGTLQPGLATSWNYEGTGNTRFVLHLRPGVKFSDGSELTAQNVVDHFTYITAAHGQLAPFFTGDTFAATDPLTVTVTAASPNPNFPELLTQDYLVGGVISPKGLQAAAQLGTQTAGAGPYTLDPAQTTTGDHYTYVPNPNYYDPGAVHWKRVVLKVITNGQSVLNALKTGQADVAVGDASTMDAAKQAGLTIAAAPLLWNGVVLADRDGTLAKALSDVRVRQALNYATDRAAIASALFGGNAQPAGQITVPGGYGYDAALDNAYPHDVAKAKGLLAEAGYPNGFPLRIVTPEYQQMNLVAQALAQQWKEIGVELQITDYASTTEYTSDAFGAKFPAFMTAFGQLPVWMEGPALFLPPATYNPFKTQDATLQSLYDQAARSSGPDKDKLDQQILGQLTHQAWFVPVVTTTLPFYARKSVSGAATSAKAPLLSLYEIQPAG